MRNNMSCTLDQLSSQPPIKPGKPTKPRSRHPPGTPLDPDELSRRLYLVLADQQRAHAERKLRAKIEAGDRKAREVRQNSTRQADPGAQTGALGGESRQTPLAARHANATGRLNPSVNPLSKRPSEVVAVDVRAAPAKRDSRSRASKGKSIPEVSASPHDGSNAPQPYVPREAAAQFARTTTAVSWRERALVPKLSRNALAFHLDGPTTDPALAANSSAAGPAEQSRDLQRVQTHREHLVERIQRQDTHTIARDTKIDEEREQQYALQGGPWRRTEDYQQHQPRRSSTGDLVDRIDRADGYIRQSMVLLDPPVIEEDEVADPTTAAEHRIDWTQSDEPKDKLKGSLRSRGSIWALKGKWGSLTRHGREEKGVVSPGDAESVTSPLSPKSPRVGFFARFKH
ncbi:uncharacterized protein E0L32_008787 [Thyridium curvatum]|uniref:Uncharacterized protein n=1 Tax=Thyridium curvatum TaxID=1093900 RepID=A0A507B094_9PEZI|nr:uncharacterized protein E0L32_008787 [Thyridium curvatum]TPX09940.1 hypothetical protein E0L32_008787 [Thyridium curvatum]